MVAQSFFANAFVADGIIPDDLGLRTVVEYRSRLYSVPVSEVSRVVRPPDEMDIVTPDEIRTNQAEDTRRAGFLKAPSSADAETVVRHLGSIVDVQGLNSFDPRYFVILRLVPPMFLSNSTRALVIEERPPDKSIFAAMRKVLQSYVRGDHPQRETEMSLVSWHWSEDLVAFATGPHLDRICAYNFNTGVCETSGERISSLEGTRCLAFRPYAGRSLAVGCRAGVSLMRGQRLDVLEARGHTHIASLDWSPDGSQLATASAADGKVRLWDVGTLTSIVVSSGSMVRFSPKKGRRFLFVASSVSPSFRLWCCDTWRSERWGSLSGPVVAATWSKDGSTLIFSTQGESAIYVLNVGMETDEETSLIHTEVTALPREGPGGTPTMLAIDDTKERLAVAYGIPTEEERGTAANEGNNESIVNNEHFEDRHRRHVVALYATQTKPTFRMCPVGYVSGPPGSGPAVGLKFKHRPPGSLGSILTCMWRNGKVSFTQLVYNASP